MVSALVPTLPVVLTNGAGKSVVAGSAAEYWNALWSGYTVSGPVPAPPRNKIPATLADLDGLKGAAPTDLDTLKEVSDELKGRLAQSTLSATYARKARIDVRDYGTVDLTGATDSSTAVLAAVAAAQALGATLVFPAGVIRVDSQILLSNNGNAGFPKQKSIRLTGAGTPWDGQWQDPLAGSGTTLDLRYQGGGAGNPKIDTRGAGVLEIDHLGLVDKGSANSAPFIRTTQTTLMVHDCLFMGNSSKNQATCDQDALILGGTTANYDNTPTSGFAGYGSIIERNLFHKIRRAFYGRVWCNSIVFQKNTITIACGSGDTHGAPIEIDSTVSSGGTGFARGNLIEGNTIEVGGYKHAVALYGTNTGSNLILHNGVWDETQGTWISDIYCGTGPTGNLYIPALNTAQPITEATPGTNRVMDWRGFFQGGWKFRNPASATTVPLQVQRAATQPVNVFESLDTAGNVQWKITSGGSLRCEANMGSDYPIKVNNDSFAVPSAYFANAKGWGAKIGDPDLQAAIGLTDGAGTSKVGLFTGTGSPEGVKSAPVGSLFLRQDGAGGSTAYLKESGTGNTGWTALTITASRTTTQLAAATDTINTTNKVAGRQAWNSTLNRPVWASGSTATSTWVFADGTTAHTPA